MKYVLTRFSLPPGVFPTLLVEKLLDLALQRFRWFEPRRYGLVPTDTPIAPGRLNMVPLLKLYEERKSLCVAGRTDQDYLYISSTIPEAPPCIGWVNWGTSPAVAKKASWRDAHALQVAEVMRLIHAPLAVSGTEEDIHDKMKRLVPQAVGSRLEFTVRDYSEGLAGLFWRNFYGAPFVRLFGDRLAAVPPGCVQALGDELVLVQPYETPQEAGTGEARAREAQLISLLGPECFYDHEKHQPPSRRTVLEYPERPVP